MEAAPVAFILSSLGDIKLGDERHGNIETKFSVVDIMGGTESCQNVHRMKPCPAGSRIQNTAAKRSLMPEEMKS
jgi:hypothetical protein